MAQPVVFVPLYNATYATRNVAFTTTAATSVAPYPAGAQAVAILPSASSYAIVGKGVVATSANGMPLPANVTTTLLVPQGDGSPWTVSVIAVSGAGTMYVKPLAKEGI